jgi:hypothetical protein
LAESAATSGGVPGGAKLVFVELSLPPLDFISEYDAGAGFFHGRANYSLKDRGRFRVLINERACFKQRVPAALPSHECICYQRPSPVNRNAYDPNASCRWVAAFSGHGLGRWAYIMDFGIPCSKSPR